MKYFLKTCYLWRMMKMYLHQAKKT
jgi:hypothetical protein